MMMLTSKKPNDLYLPHAMYANHVVYRLLGVGLPYFNFDSLGQLLSNPPLFGSPKHIFEIHAYLHILQ